MVGRRSHRLLLLGVDVLDEPVGDELGPAEADSSLCRSFMMCCLRISSFWSSTKIGGSRSEKRRSSRLAMSRITETSAEISTDWRSSRSVLTSLSGSWCTPTRAVDEDLGRGGDRRRGDLAEVLRAKEGGGRDERSEEGRRERGGGRGRGRGYGTRLDAPLVEELEDGRGADRDVRHQREILDEAAVAPPASPPGTPSPSACCAAGAASPACLRGRSACSAGGGATATTRTSAG